MSMTFTRPIYANLRSSGHFYRLTPKYPQLLTPPPPIHTLQRLHTINDITARVTRVPSASHGVQLSCAKNLKITLLHMYRWM